MKVIRFRRLDREPVVNGIEKRVNNKCSSKFIEKRIWEIALNEEQLFTKLGGEMAEIIMPAEPLLKRMWLRFFPRCGIEGK